MKKAFVWVNGQRMDAATAHVSALDRGFLLADGLFETVRIYGGHPFLLDRHLRRLEDSAEALGFPGAKAVAGLLSASLAEAANEGVREAVLRVTLTRGPGFGVQLPRDPQPTVVIVIRSLADTSVPAHADGVSGVLVSGRRNELSPSAGHKTLSVTDAVLALDEARTRGAQEAILLDTRGRVSEASYSNIFMVRNGVLTTPSLACGPLPGITRAVVLELAGDVAGGVEEREIWPEELLVADELFATSAVRGIVSVVRLNDEPVGHGAPGVYTSRLRELYLERVAARSG